MLVRAEFQDRLRVMGLRVSDSFSTREEAARGPRNIKGDTAHEMSPPGHLQGLQCLQTCCSQACLNQQYRDHDPL